MEIDPVEILRNLETKLKSFMSTETSERKALETQLKTLRDGVEQFTKQRAFGGGHSYAERDPEYKGRFPNADRAAAFGAFVLAGVHPAADVRKACAEHVVKSGVTLRTKDGQVADGETFVKAMGESTDAGGGYLVPDELGRTLIRHVDEFGTARRKLTKVPMGSDRQIWPRRTGGLTVYYPDEGVAATASDLTFGKVTLTAKKWAVYTVLSREIEADAVIAIGELVATEIAAALARAEDLNCFMGDGTSTYAGITGVFNSANVAVVTMDSGKDTFVELSYGNLIDLQHAVPKWVRQLPDCAYYMHSAIKGQCMKMVDATSGLPIFQHPAEGFPMQIGGFPVEEVEILPDLTDSAASTKFMAFGSLGAWGLLGQRRQMLLERSNEVKWLEDQIAVKAVPRQDIQEAVGEAMAVLKTAAE